MPHPQVAGLSLQRPSDQGHCLAAREVRPRMVGGHVAYGCPRPRLSDSPPAGDRPQRRCSQAQASLASVRAATLAAARAQWRFVAPSVLVDSAGEELSLHFRLARHVADTRRTRGGGCAGEAGLGGRAAQARANRRGVHRCQPLVGRGSPPSPSQPHPCPTSTDVWAYLIWRAGPSLALGCSRGATTSRPRVSIAAAKTRPTTAFGCAVSART